MSDEVKHVGEKLMADMARMDENCMLDEIWPKLVESGDDTAVCLEAMYQRQVQEAETTLNELRDLARQYAPKIES